MKTRTEFDTILLTILSTAALCALMFCSGCLHYKISIGDDYRIDDKGGVPMLVPIATQSVNSAEFQTVVVTLPTGPSDAKIRGRDDCTVQGAVFSMRSSSSSSNRSWVIRSPSTLGRETLGAKIDVEAQWRLFIRDLARIYDKRCFPSGLSAQSIRSAIARRIPLPASEVPILTYSDQGERFVNLVPDMEIRVQRVLSPAASDNPGLHTSPRILTAVYDVISRHDGGVSLRRNPNSDGSERGSFAMQDRQFLTLNQPFARTPVLRLFLQGWFSQTESHSDPILIGTSNATQLDVLTDLIRQRDPVACIDLPGTVCIKLPPGSVSLFSIIWINGRRTTCPFGTSLASLLFRLPEPKQPEALESVHAIRRLSPDHYAGIQITRTLEGTAQLLLLPGDRIEWKE